MDSLYGLVILILVIGGIGFITTRLGNNKALKSCNGHCLLIDGKIEFFDRDIEKIKYAIAMHSKCGVHRDRMELKACNIENDFIKGEVVTYVHEKVTML